MFWFLTQPIKPQRTRRASKSFTLNVPQQIEDR
jgi:hypothetical protein